MKHPV